MNLGHPDFGHLIGFQWQKAFGGASGKWTLTFKKGKTAPFQLWRQPEDVWVLFEVELGGDRYPLTLGLVDTLQRSITRDSNGARSEVWQLSGRDCGKVFETIELYINIHEHSGMMSTLLPAQSALANATEGSPVDFITAILTAWLGNNGAADALWQLPSGLGSQSFYDALVYKFSPTRGRLYDSSFLNIMSFQGKQLWSTLQEYQNGLLNEMWVDYSPNAMLGTGQEFRPALHLRERPFPTFEGGRRRWDALRTHEIGPEDIRTDTTNLGNPTERFNYWMIDVTGIGGDNFETGAAIQQAGQRGRGQPGAAPIWNLDSMRRHGFRRWEQTTRFIPMADDQAWLLQAAAWLAIAHDWYVISPEQRSGSLGLVSMQPWIRIGDRVRVKEYNGSTVVYYVEGVSDSYNYPDAGSTTLTVTRGEEENANLLSTYYAKVVSQDANADPTQDLSSLDSALGPPDPDASLNSASPWATLPAEAAFDQNPQGQINQEAAAHSVDDLDAPLTDADRGDLQDRQVGPATAAITDRTPAADATLQQTQDGEFGQERLERGDDLPTETPSEDQDVTRPLGPDETARRGGPL